MVEADFELSPSDGECLALLHRSGVVLSTQYDGDRVLVRARVRASLCEMLNHSPEKVLTNR